MYTRKEFKESDTIKLIHLMKEIKFGALVVFAENQFFVAQVPFLVKHDAEYILLECHVAIANEIWKVAHSASKAMAILQGAHTYIHPGWYPTKKAEGKVVPTYNYQAIHCYGHAVKEQSATWILRHLQELTNEHEKDQSTPWQVNDAPEDFIKTLAKGVVGITLHVETIEGTVKMNQNHSQENRLGVIEHLAKSSQPQDQAVCNIMQAIECQRDKKI